MLNKIFGLIFIVCSVTSSAKSSINDRFEHIKSNPQALYTVLKVMPKGGELHYHFLGGVSAEAMLELAAKGNYCIDRKMFILKANQGICTGISSKSLLDNKVLYNQVIQQWSMKDFIAQDESGHDHFFSSFEKFVPIADDYKTKLLADVIRHAADQHELYMEIQMYSLSKSEDFAKLLNTANSLAEKRKILLNNMAFKNAVQQIVHESREDLGLARRELGCDAKQTPACSLEVKFQFFVLRNESLNSFFAQALAGFMAAMESNTIVGVNVVQSENDPMTLKHYKDQMKIFNYLHHIYPKVHLSLHAGELAPSLVSRHDLSFHIHDAVFTGHAERIGHGVDITYEKNSADLLKYMAKKLIAVEVNLISNEAILNVFGKDHPLEVYLKHHVPIVLSTDDEGILRTDLTQQYVNAVNVHHLTYPAIKMINRNALTFSFLSGKSLWEDPLKAKPVAACRDFQSDECKNFVRLSEKAGLQWKLEQLLFNFERQYNDKSRSKDLF